MKNIFLKLTLSSLMIAISLLSFSQTKKFMSFNIRYDNQHDAVNKWDNRKGELSQLINYYNPDIIGLQEGLNHQLDYLKIKLPNYEMIGVGREDGKTKGEFTAIFYDTLIYRLLEQNTFWLSETENIVSVGWDAALPRICTYGLFINKKTKEKLYVFNTHFDHIGNQSRIMSAKQILQKIAKISIVNDPIVLMGDFNSEPNDEPIQIFSANLTDGGSPSKTNIYGPTGTFNGFEKDKLVNKRIDYIFTKHFEVINYRHIDDKMKNNNYISDHYPVLVEVN